MELRAQPEKEALPVGHPGPRVPAGRSPDIVLLCTINMISLRYREPKTASGRTLGSMKLRPLLVIAAVAAFFAALARKRVEEAKPTESWEPVSYS
jgi:hypothetical protein